MEFLPNSGHAVPRWEESSAVTFQRAFRPFRFHDLRHAFAVNALKSGMSIYSLSNGSIGSLKRERAIAIGQLEVGHHPSGGRIDLEINFIRSSIRRHRSVYVSL